MVEFNCLKPFTKASKKPHITFPFHWHTEVFWEVWRIEYLLENKLVKCIYSKYSTLDFTGRFQFQHRHLRGLHCTTGANLIYTIRMTASKRKTYYICFKQVYIKHQYLWKSGHYSFKKSLLIDVFYFILIIHCK